MVTRGAPNISLLPPAGTEIVRAREREQAVNLQAALARLQAQAQAAQLEEQAREFDVNAMIRRESLALDNRFRREELSLRQQQFGQRAAEFRFTGEQRAIELGLSQERLGLEAEREKRIAQQVGQEFGLRSEQFRDAQVRADRAEKLTRQTVAMKRFGEKLNILKESGAFDFDKSDPLNPITFKEEAAPLLESLGLDFEEFAERPLTMDQLEKLLNRPLARFVEQEQTQRALQLLGAQGVAQRIRTSRSQEVANLAAAQRPRGPTGPSPQALALGNQAKGIQDQIEIVERAIGQLDPAQAGDLIQRRQQLEEARDIIIQRLSAQQSLEQATQGPLGITPPLPPIPEIPGLPSVTPTGALPAPPVPGARAPGITEEAARQAGFDTLRNTRNAALRFQLPSRRAEETLTVQERQTLGTFVQAGLQVTDISAQNELIGTLSTRIDDEIKRQNEAFAERNQEPPERVIASLRQQKRQFKEVIRQNEKSLVQVQQQQQNALNNMTNEAVTVLRARLVDEHGQLSTFIDNLEDQRDKAEDNVEREDFDKQIAGSNKALAGLSEMRARAADKANRARDDQIDLKIVSAAIKQSAGRFDASSPQLQGTLNELKKDVDFALALNFGDVGGFNLAFSRQTRPAKLEAGVKMLDFYRNDGLLFAFENPKELRRSLRFAVPLVETGKAPVFEIFATEFQTQVSNPLRAAIGAFLEIDREVEAGPALIKGLPGFDTRSALRLMQLLPFEQQRNLPDILEFLSTEKVSVTAEGETKEQAVPKEFSKTEMEELVKNSLRGENPENVLGWSVAMRLKGFSSQEVFNIVRPFDFYGLFPNPAKAIIPSISLKDAFLTVNPAFEIDVPPLFR